MRSLANLLALSALVWCAASCSNDSESTGTPVPTSVAVDPLDFMGSVPCSVQAGAARSYVATVTDLTTGLNLATSPVVSCSLPVAFEGVVVGDSYAASIQVFTDPSGAGTPQWTTSCAQDGTGAAVAATNERVFIRNCVALTGPGAGTTGVSVDATALAAPIGCNASTGGAGGSGGSGVSSSSASSSTSSSSVSSSSSSASSTSASSTSASSTSGTGGSGGSGATGIEKLTVVPDDRALPSTTIACGQGPVVFETGVTAGKVYGFLVQGFEAGAADFRWGARCTASAVEGVTSPASCDGLTEFGSIRIDVAAVLFDALLECDPSTPAGASTLDVSFGDGDAEVAATGLACDHDVVLGPLTRGSHAGEVTLRGQGGALKGHAICFASVEPATVALANCVAD